MQHISERLKWIRKHYLQLTQTQFAYKLGVTESTIKNYERIEGTKPGVDELVKLIEIDQNIDVQWILTGTGERQINKDSISKISIHSNREDYENLPDKISFQQDIKNAMNEIIRLNNENRKLRNELNLIKTGQSIKKDDSLIENLDQEQDM